MRLIHYLFLIPILIFIPAHGIGVSKAALEMDIEALINQKGNGFYLCGDIDNIDTCTKVDSYAKDNGGDGVSQLVFNVSVEAYFYLGHDQPPAGRKISLIYDGSAPPTCFYQFTQGEGKPIKELPCSQAVRGDSALYEQPEGSGIYALNLDELCREDNSGNGESCSDWFTRMRWSDSIESYEIEPNAYIPPGLTENTFGCMFVVNPELPYTGECKVRPDSISCTEGRFVDFNRCDRFSGRLLNASACVNAGPFSCTTEEIVGPGEQIPTNLAQKIADLYKNILGLAGVVALGILIFGGVLWSLSAGNPSRITEAKTWITSALVGLGLLFSAYLILTFINPDLTNLQEIFLDPNPTLVPGELTLPELRGSTCDGFYDETNAPEGNFGDPLCEYADEETRPQYMQDLSRVIVSELTSAGFNQYPGAVNRLANILYTDIIACESPSYSPNAYLEASGSRLGAYGLFQMNPKEAGRAGGLDAGNVPWREQVNNAIRWLWWTNNETQEGQGLCKGTERGCIYWACWDLKGHVCDNWLGEEIPGCETCMADCVRPPSQREYSECRKSCVGY